MSEATQDSGDNRTTQAPRARRRLNGRLVWPLLVTASLLPVTFLIPLIDSTREPYVDLTSRVATLSYWVAQSGGPVGAPIVGTVMLLLLVTRRGISGARRAAEAVLVASVVTICGGGAAALNEHVVKNLLRVPRPNIIFLAGDDGTGPLGMSADEFYLQGDKLVRGTALTKVLDGDRPPVMLSPAIRAHWIVETGYSFPSGHSLFAMYFATFFLAMGVQYVAPPRLWLFYLLLPWALAVCYSRPILRVHTPTDIVVGGLEGVVLGGLAFLLVRAILTAWYERID